MLLQNNISVIIGNKGCGKTSLVRQLCQEEMRKRNRLFILDTLGDMGEVVPESLPVTMAGMEQYTRNASYRIRIHPQSEQQLDACLNQAWLVGDCLIVVDESGHWVSTAYMSPGVSSLLDYGRHRKLDALFVARRSIELHRTMTAQADTFYLFHSHEPRDISYIAASISSDVADMLPKLKLYEYVKFSYPNKLSRGKTRPLPSIPSKQAQTANLLDWK
jgi:hypothetical protein